MSSEENTIQKLQKWNYSYTNKLEGNSQKIKIDNIDNPGWGIDIDLSRTDLEDLRFNEKSHVTDEQDWFFCKKEKSIFKGRGDAKKLNAILQEFINWIENDTNDLHTKKSYSNKDVITRLENWYLSLCDGSWEHQYGIIIESNTSGWSITVEIIEVYLNEIPFAPIEIYRKKDNFITCKKENNLFVGICGPLNLEETLDLFLIWAEKHMPEDKALLHNYPP